MQKKRMDWKTIKQEQTGGKAALDGFSYQCLYSCYKALTFLDDDNKWLQFEGIDDVDACYGRNECCLFQLKHSQGQQDASFLKPVLANYLKVFLHREKVDVKS